MTWAPIVAASLLVLIGAIGLFKPMQILGNLGVTLSKPGGWSEMRALFGGPLLGCGLAALYLQSREVYLVLGFGLGIGCLARLWSMVVDGLTLRDGAGMLIADAVLALLFLTVLW